MPVLHLTNFVAAPIERVFDLSRNISIHKIAFQKNKIWPVAGITSGLIKKDETVTWKMNYLFKTRMFRIKITKMNPFENFEEKTINNNLITFRHEHFFKSAQNGTIIIDKIDYQFKNRFLEILLSKVVSAFFEKNITQRIEVINQYALTDKWKALLNS